MNRRHFLGAAAFGLSSAASAKVVPVDLKSRNFEPLKLPRPISLADLALTMSPLDRARMYLEDMVAVLNAAGEH